MAWIFIPPLILEVYSETLPFIQLRAVQPIAISMLIDWTGGWHLTEDGAKNCWLVRRELFWHNKEGWNNKKKVATFMLMTHAWIQEWCRQKEHLVLYKCHLRNRMSFNYIDLLYTLRIRQLQSFLLSRTGLPDRATF